MIRTITQIDYTWAPRPRNLKLPFHYRFPFGADLHFWAEAAGRTPARLRLATESVIRRCHHAAVLEEPSINGRPEIYELGLGCLKVFYSVESAAIVVRGYGPNLPSYFGNEHMCGCYSCDF